MKNPKPTKAEVKAVQLYLKYKSAIDFVVKTRPELLNQIN